MKTKGGDIREQTVGGRCNYINRPRERSNNSLSHNLFDLSRGRHMWMEHRPQVRLRLTQRLRTLDGFAAPYLYFDTPSFTIF